MRKVAEFYKRLPLLSFQILRRPFQKSHGRILTTCSLSKLRKNKPWKGIIQYKIEDETGIQTTEILPP